MRAASITTSKARCGIPARARARWGHSRPCVSSVAATDLLRFLTEPEPGLLQGGLANSVVFISGYRVLSKGLTRAGIANAWLLGTLTFAEFGLRGYALVCLYFVLGTAATKVRMQAKEEEGLAEKNKGRRGPASVWGSGLAGAACACLALSPLPLPRDRLVAAFVASFSAKFGDTVSSEIGKAFGRLTILPTTLQPVPRGTEGAVSAEGTAAGLVAAVGMALLGAAFKLVSVEHAAAVAFAAALANIGESFVGALLQGKVPWLTNDVVNASQLVVTFSQISFASLVAYLLT